jgi:hypothetical protein
MGNLRRIRVQSLLKNITRLVALLAGTLSMLAESDSDVPGTLPAPTEQHFRKGQIEGSTGAGVMFSPFFAPRRPTFNFATGFVQAGVMLNEPRGTGFFRGNLQSLVEGFGSGIFSGRGHYTAGTTLRLRYNFLQPAARLVPYAQAGAGMLLTDMDRGIVGQAFNFNLDGGLGLRYFLKPKVSLNLEYRIQHISNANTGVHNLGVNSQGAMLSLSWFF